MLVQGTGKTLACACPGRLILGPLWHRFFLLQDMNYQWWWHGVSKPVGSSGSYFICSGGISVAVPVNTALLLFAICIVPMLARMAMGILAARRSFSNSIASLLYMVQSCATTRFLLEGLSLFPVVPLPLNSSAFPGSVALFRMGSVCCLASYFGAGVCLCVTYGSCEGDINWEARMSFHSSACLLLGKGMVFVA